MKNPVTESLIKELKRTTKLASPEAQFVGEYYHRLSTQDYSPDRVGFLLQSARLHLELAQKRQASEHLVKVDHLDAPDGQHRALVNIVTIDRPFIIDSLIIALGDLNKRIERINHPIFNVSRNKRNKLVELHRRESDQQQSGNQSAEAFIQFETDAVSKEESKQICQQLLKVLQHIEGITADWLPMKQATLELGKKIEKAKQGPAFAEYQALLNWMAEDHFAFFGYGEIEQTIDQNGKSKNRVLPESLIGILKIYHQEQTDILSILPPLVESKTAPLIFTQSRQRIRIHRANYLDVILIDQNYGAKSKGKTRKRTVSCIVGFLAGSTATMALATIPHLRSKAAYILQESTLRKRSYAYKELRTIIENLPRSMIFQLGSKALYRLCMSLLNHQERRKTRVHLNHNVCEHFYTCLVYIPRDLFNTALRKRIQSHLAQRLNAYEVTFNVHFSESVLTRIHFTAFTEQATSAKIKKEVLESEIQSMAKDWHDHLLHEAQAQLPLNQANSLYAAWNKGFSANYQLDHDADKAISDIALLDEQRIIDLGEPLSPCLLAAKVECDGAGAVSHLRLYSADQSMPLSDVLPILDNMGLRVPAEQPYSLTHVDGQTFWINHFEIVGKSGEALDGTLKQVIEDGFIATWFDRCENDGFNQLIVASGFSWRQVSLIRCYFHYLRQLRLRYSSGHIIESLLKNPQLIQATIGLFESRFSASSTAAETRRYEDEIKEGLHNVQTLDEERIFNALLDTLNATVRTNYFQSRDGDVKSTISLKLNPRRIPRVPEPAPKHEIFVYSPRMEGVHLRGGDVARGGLRWSERPDDFRTEVLGLVKAQQVKNAVIVPVGSKGGFVAKKLPEGDRSDIQKEVIACYQLFIAGLLDITDNIVGKKIVPPEDCVRLDPDDPYLVVAADKGTATFSDIANALSLEAGFWLGDAFASGGSDGYDHKKMGITARGAWESVKRHFREQGKDIQSQEFTVAAIGDMAGDVFGNGMLLSKKIRMVAAFNHMHIFIDPSPDAAKSYSERKRLFDLPRSSWTDYNTKLISAGGGIYSRTDKSITLSPQAMKALSTEQNRFTPDELINVILKSEVELLWNGGIGTYIKASDESHDDAQDRNNDSLRVDASELRIKVMGEGGNLGLTQKARIEFNALGGYCYTDAIDNSAGVDTSDHEVNIKILLNQLVARKKLDVGQRNRLLAKMERAVAEHVLANNYIQSEILSIEGNFAAERMPGHTLALQSLTASGQLNRQIEQLPDDNELANRRGQGKSLTRAELAVVLAYSKMDVYQQMLDSAIPGEKHIQPVLLSYFPALLVEQFESDVRKHPLGKEIISTVVTNDMVGTMGPAFHYRIAQATGAQVDAIIRAYLLARNIIHAGSLANAIRKLDNKMPTDLQQRLLIDIAGAIESNTVWILEHANNAPDIAEFQKRYGKSLKAFDTALSKGTGIEAPSASQALSKELARYPAIKNESAQLQQLWILHWCLDISDIAMQHNVAVGKVIQCYFHVQQQLSLDVIRGHIAALPADDQWRQQASSTLANALRSAHAAIVTAVLNSAGKGKVEQQTEDWLASRSDDVSTIQSMQDAIMSEGEADFAMLSVLGNAITRLAQH